MGETGKDVEVVCGLRSLNLFDQWGKKCELLE